MSCFLDVERKLNWQKMEEKHGHKPLLLIDFKPHQIELKVIKSERNFFALNQNTINMLKIICSVSGTLRGEKNDQL